MTRTRLFRPGCPCCKCHEGRLYNARQRRLTAVLSTVLAGLLYALWRTMQ